MRAAFGAGLEIVAPPSISRVGRPRRRASDERRTPRIAFSGWAQFTNAMHHIGGGAEDRRSISADEQPRGPLDIYRIVPIDHPQQLSR
jgi:hypothetical protein